MYDQTVITYLGTADSNAVDSYAYKQLKDVGYVSDSLAVSVCLQLIYICKFFWWETGYWCSIDIMHDRAGYYLCWGCLCWVTCVYTSPSMYLCSRPINLGLPLASFIFMFGFLAIFLNYDSDNQRYIFRKNKGKVYVIACFDPSFSSTRDKETKRENWTELSINSTQTKPGSSLAGQRP